jgi:hypothetical protein
MQLSLHAGRVQLPRAVQLRQYKQYKNIFKSIALSLVSCEIKLLYYYIFTSLFYSTLLFSIFKLSAKFRL